MRSRAWVVVGVASAVLLVGALMAQERPGRRGMGRDRWQQMSPEERAQVWQRMQERRLARLKERLGVSDEEWEVLAEPIGGLLALRREEMSASLRLREAAGGEEVKPAELQQALREYRSARERLAAERKKLQAQLKGLVSLRQEVVLVLERLLD